MKFNCAHSFTLEASDREEFDAKLSRYSEMVHRASERLDIGYAHGLMFGAPGAPPSELHAVPDDEPIERLFDD